MAATYMTVDEAAAELNIKPETLYEWVRNGEISHQRWHNRFIRFTQADLDDYAARHRIPASENLGRSRPKRRRSA